MKLFAKAWNSVMDVSYNRGKVSILMAKSQILVLASTQHSII